MLRSVSMLAVLTALTCFSSAGCSSSTPNDESVGPGVLLTGADAATGSTTGGGGSTTSGGGSTTGGGGSTTGGGGPTSPPSGAESTGCDGAKLLAVPTDLAARGPWAVGARTVEIAGLPTEVLYPAQIGSESGKAKASYDIRDHLPDAEKAKIPDAENPLQACDCFRDLPIDAAHGAYPVVQFIHGTAAFRTQSLTQMVHWASRGFVVVSSDHPKIRLKDLLGNLAGSLGADQKGDARKVLDALMAPSGDIAFLQGHIDLTRIAISGHSAGGGALAGFGSRAGVKVLMPLASGGVQAGSSLVSTLVMGGQDDGLVAYTGVKSGYTSSPKKKRLVGIAKAGHLAFSDLCFIGRDKGGILAIAQKYNVTNADLVGRLAQDGCKPGQLAAEEGWTIINHATAGVLEETLACSTTAAAELEKLKTLPNVGDYQADL
jgi:Chlorophyllase